MPAQLLKRIRACWRLKAFLAVTVGPAFCVLYLLIGNFPLLPVRELPLTALDRAIGFHPDEWTWIYQSEYLMINLIPWLADRRDQLHRYVRGFAVLSLISFAFFLAVPIRAPKPHVPNPTGMYWLLQQYDVHYNSLPSLHAGIIVYTLAFGHRILRRDISLGMKLFALIWGALILSATLATKEHYAVDILTGGLLGLGMHFWVWRPTPSPVASPVTGPLLEKS